VVLTATPNPAEETPPPASEPAASVVDPAPPVTKPSTVAAAGFPDAAARPGAPDPPGVVDAVADVAPPVVELPEPESALEAPLATAASADVPRKGFFNRLRSMFSRRDVDVVVPQTPGDEPYEPDPVAVMVEAEPRAGTQDSMSAAREWAVAGREPLPATSDPVAATPEPTDPGAEPLDARAALDAALDSLGQAHHRPFSRS
jgi:hypothetical protein